MKFKLKNPYKDLQEPAQANQAASVSSGDSDECSNQSAAAGNCGESMNDRSVVRDSPKGGARPQPRMGGPAVFISSQAPPRIPPPETAPIFGNSTPPSASNNNSKMPRSPLGVPYHPEGDFSLDLPLPGDQVADLTFGLLGEPVPPEDSPLTEMGELHTPPCSPGGQKRETNQHTLNKSLTSQQPVIDGTTNQERGASGTSSNQRKAPPPSSIPSATKIGDEKATGTPPSIKMNLVKSENGTPNKKPQKFLATVKRTEQLLKAGKKKKAYCYPCEKDLQFQAMERHVYSHYADDKECVALYQCSVCSFTSFSALNQHMRNSHQITATAANVVDRRQMVEDRLIEVLKWCFEARRDAPVTEETNPLPTAAVRATAVNPSSSSRFSKPSATSPPAPPAELPDNIFESPAKAENLPGPIQGQGEESAGPVPSASAEARKTVAYTVSCYAKAWRLKRAKRVKYVPAPSWRRASPPTALRQFVWPLLEGKERGVQRRLVRKLKILKRRVLVRKCATFAYLSNYFRVVLPLARRRMTRAAQCSVCLHMVAPVTARAIVLHAFLHADLRPRFWRLKDFEGAELELFALRLTMALFHDNFKSGFVPRKAEQSRSAAQPVPRIVIKLSSSATGGRSVEQIDTSNRNEANDTVEVNKEPDAVGAETTPDGELKPAVGGEISMDTDDSEVNGDSVNNALEMELAMAMG